jgi:hydroxymethylglutaryl-CoA lyase
VTLPARVIVRELGPRDGLQSEAPVSVADRAELIDSLVGAGVAEIEAVSFVSPKSVPSMAGAAEVIAAIHRRPSVRYWALVPNRKGAELAIEAEIDALTVTLSACPVYNEHNVKMTVDRSLDALAGIVEVAGERLVDAVVSCAFGSPYTGDIAADFVAALAERVHAAGVEQLTFADTTGMATPTRVDALIDAVGTDVGLHFHDTRGTALLCSWHAIERGVTRFDTAVGGLGGSPFAKGASGNLGTEDLVHVLDDAGVATGIDLQALLDVSHWLAGVVGHDLPSRVANHGPRVDTTRPIADL